MTTARVTSKGQVTIPKDVRESMGLEPGDQIEFVKERKGFRVVKRPARSPFDEFLGFLKDLKGRDSDDLVEEMRGR